MSAIKQVSLIWLGTNFEGRHYLRSRKLKRQLKKSDFIEEKFYGSIFKIFSDDFVTKEICYQGIRDSKGLIGFGEVLYFGDSETTQSLCARELYNNGLHNFCNAREVFGRYGLTREPNTYLRTLNIDKNYSSSEKIATVIWLGVKFDDDSKEIPQALKDKLKENNSFKEYELEVGGIHSGDQLIGFGEVLFYTDNPLQNIPVPIRELYTKGLYHFSLIREICKNYDLDVEPGIYIRSLSTIK